MSLWLRESLSGFCNFILKFEFSVDSHFCLFLEASKDFLFRLCQSLSGSTRGNAVNLISDNSEWGISVLLSSSCLNLPAKSYQPQDVALECYEIVDVTNATSSWYEMYRCISQVVSCHLKSCLALQGPKVTLVTPPVKSAGPKPGLRRRGRSIGKTKRCGSKANAAKSCHSCL
ncbi:hypothetical protein H5410_002043, partial [Solanum commersonii]